MRKIYAFQIDACLIETHIELFKRRNSICVNIQIY